MAQIIPIVSDALQATIRRLLPSQSGFGEDLQAQNVIVPIIDLTPSAEGSAIGTDLQQAIAFGSQTAFNAAGGSDIVANTPGFYRIWGVAQVTPSPSGSGSCTFTMSDGLSVKTVWGLSSAANGNNSEVAASFDFVVFLAAGESITAVSSNGGNIMTGSSRQIASVTGELVNPSGFVVQ